MRQPAPIRFTSVIITVALASVVTLTVTPHAEAQYFGRNKVQYKQFNFEVLETDHFRIYFYPEEREAANELARMAERWYARLSKIFGYDLSTTQPIVVYASAPDFRQTNVIAGEIGEGTGGVTEGAKRRIVLPLAGTLAETDHVLGHELVHAFQYDLSRTDPNRGAGSGISRIPLWFIEGMAEYLSIGPVDPHTAMWIRDAAREEGKLPSIGDLSDPRYFPYRWGQALWSYVAGRWGDSIVELALQEALRTGSATAALERVSGLSAKELTREWHDAIRAHYAPVLASTRRASAIGRSLTPDQKERGLAVSPALSPDGTRVAYLSERDLLSIDLYLADANTGQVIRKLVNTSVDPHFSSIQFIASAGTWRPDGREFAFAAIRDATPVVVIVDVDRGQRVREVPFDDLGEIVNPSWSPDGRAIVFSATSGGRSDLYIYDLQSGARRRLTSDAFADLQPAWSPAGDRIAFVTDRFSTDLPRLDAGRFELALIDVASGRIEGVRGFDRGKSINPQWAPGGRTLYFLSDVTGVTDVYAVELLTGRISQVTNLDAGASGITALSPALSASLDANRLAFSGYEDGRIGLFVIEGAEALKGKPLDRTAEVASAEALRNPPVAAVLPPSARPDNEVTALLSDADTGLVEAPKSSTPYRGGLSLDAVGQPYIAAGVDRFGGMYGGGLSFALSDMLGNHNVFAAIDVNTYGGWNDFYRNTGGLVAYQNLKHRWNWGIAGGQTPYLAGGFASGTSIVNGQPALVEQQIIQRQTYRGVESGVAYPFSEARRLEFSGGYQQVTFDQQTRTIATSIRTGQLLSDDTETTELADALQLGTATMALVFDTARFGATSPVAGQRSRFEVSPTVGSLSFTGALADYRRYDMPAPFLTIASRVMHFGRYGRDAESGRLLPLFIGYPELIRGYGIGSFRTNECVTGASGTCEAFDRLLGSRMLIGNLELRFPLLRAFGVRNAMYGPVPVEVAFFADGGVAWTKADRPTFLGGDRRPVSSAGVSFRVNLFGFAVGQMDLAYPFQRQGRGWVWGFSLTPGF